MTKPHYSIAEIAAKKGAIQHVLIEYDQLDQVQDALELRILAGTGGESAKLTMLVAPSGCGKTTTVKQAQSRLETKPDIAKNSLLPILYCSLPPKCSIKAMTTSLLAALHDPLADRQSTRDMNDLRIIGQLKAQHVRLLVLDEFQHLIGASVHSSLHKEATDWLKKVLDGAGVPVVCVGLPESLSVIATHDQIRRRTTRIIRMKPFAWDDGGPKSKMFQAFLHVFERELDLPENSGLGQPAMAERIHIASGGLVGVVAQLLSEAVEVSLRRRTGPECLTLGDLAEAYDGLPYELLNPFDDDLAPEDIRAAREAGIDDHQDVRLGDSLPAINRRAGPHKKWSRTNARAN